MENNVKKTLDNFLGASDNEMVLDTQNNKKKVIIKERDGLTERINPIILVEDGRQLLREQY
jgi:hypothetical protein